MMSEKLQEQIKDGYIDIDDTWDKDELEKINSALKLQQLVKELIKDSSDWEPIHVTLQSLVKESEK